MSTVSAIGDMFGDKQHAAMNSADTVLRTVGTIKLWWGIVRGAIISVILVILVVMLIRYHQNWRYELTKVQHIACNKPSDEYDKNAQTSKIVETCTLHLSGFKQPFWSTYDVGKVPSVGGTVKVYYNPSDRSSAMLGNDSFFSEHKTKLICVIVGVIIVILVTMVVQFTLRHNRIAQRVAGGAAVFDIASSM